MKNTDPESTSPTGRPHRKRRKLWTTDKERQHIRKHDAVKNSLDRLFGKSPPTAKLTSNWSDW